MGCFNIIDNAFAASLETRSYLVFKNTNQFAPQFIDKADGTIEIRITVQLNVNDFKRRIQSLFELRSYPVGIDRRALIILRK